MWPVSPRFVAALRRPHAVVSACTLSRPSVADASLTVVGGSVTVDAGSRVRRRLTLDVVSSTVDRMPGLFAALAGPGAELRPYRGLRYADGTTELVPLGVFGVDVDSISYDPGGTVSVQGVDRFARVTEARFEAPVTTNGLAVTEALRLATAAGSGWSSRNDSTSTATTRQAVWDRDRDMAVEELAQAAGAEVFFDAAGVAVARDVPSISGTPVWSVDASETGVLLGATRTRQRAGTYNVVVVVPVAVDGVTPFAPVTVADTDSTSPTYVSTYGRVPRFYASPLVTTSTQATTAGLALLRRASAVNASMTLQSVVNPALDAGDVVTVLLPDMTTERHLIESVTIPLDLETAQRLQTRSSSPGALPAEAL